MQNNRLQCECGKQFNNEKDLQEHQKNCSMARSSDKPMTHSAGGGPQRQS
jgi:hypothetical protein